MIRTSLRIFISLIIAVAIWLIGPLIAIGTYHPLGWLWLRQALIALTLIWGFWPIIVRFTGWLFSRSKKRQGKLPPPTYDRVSNRLADLDRTLKQSLSERKRGTWQRLIFRVTHGHRHELPWFMMLGASGSGKTSLLNHGGQSSLAANSGAQLRLADPNGQTVDCGFWVAEQGVWIDTSGKWSEREALDDSDNQAWKKLLQGIRRMRRRPALDGVVLCIDLEWLGLATSEQRKRQGDSLRGRILELANWFGTDIPVYVALTHLDSLPGGPAFMNYLEDANLEKGMGFELTGTDLLKPDELDAKLIEFEHRLQQTIRYVQPQSRDAETSRHLVLLSESISSRRAALSDLLLAIVGHPVNTLGGQLRGVWLGTSVYLMDEGSDVVQLDEPSSATSLRALGKTYRAPLDQAIRERGIVAERSRHLLSTTQRIFRWGLVGTLLFGCAAWLGLTYLEQRDYIAHVEAQFTEGKRLAREHLEHQSGNQPLMDVSAQMRYAGDEVAGDSPIWFSSFFEHHRIEGVANETYRRHLFKSFMPEMHNFVTAQLRDEVKLSQGDIYDTLKIYLMMSRPERRDPEALTRWFERRWSRIAPATFDADDKRMFMKHLSAAFSPPKLPATPEDSLLVGQARAAASAMPSLMRVIRHITDQGLPGDIEDISLSKAGGLNAPMVLRIRNDTPATAPIISGWYTRAGYQDVFMRRIEKSTRAVLDEEAWVLRDQASAGNAFQLEKAVQDLSDAARRQFLQDYVVRWRDFLSSITIRHFSGLDDAAQLAKALAEPDSALAFLIRFAGRETSLTGNYEGDVDSWIDRQKQRLEKGRRAIVGEISGQNYRNKVLPEHVVDDYFNAVRRMGLSLNQAGTTGEGGGNPLVRLFEPLYRQLALVSGAIEAGQVLPGYDAFGRLRADAAKQPEPVRGIMLDLVNLSGSMTAEKSGATLSRGAEGSSRALCQSAVAGRYPLVRSAKNEVGTEDFKRLFGPQGAMSSYFDSQLAQYVDTASLPWKARRLEGLSGNLINPQIIRSYEQAKTIRDTFFNPQGQLGFSMVIRPVDMDASIGEAILEISGEQMRYTHGGSVPKKFEWSPSNARMVVRLQLRGLDGRIQHLEYLGSWAIFKFFDAGERKKFAEDKQELVYRTPLGSVTFEFQALTNDFPLWSNALSQFRCPGRS